MKGLRSVLGSRHSHLTNFLCFTHTNMHIWSFIHSFIFYFFLEITSTTKQRNSRARGPTRCLNLWNRDGTRICVTTNELGQPIGLEAPKLTSFLGTVARDGLMAPLIYADWRAMPDAKKEKMWQQVEVSGGCQFSLCII